MTRKRAPGRPGDHPDWMLSLSGGVDSAAAALTTIDALRSHDHGGNYAKAPFAIYLDTRTGAPLNHLYVEQLCDWLDVQLWTLRTDEKFEDWLRRDGAPGSGAHQHVRNELKDRQVSKLTTIADHPVYVLGLAADESDTRASFPKARQLRRHTEVYPVHRLTREERVEIILRSGCPINPLWLHPDAIHDCGCLCNGDPSEKQKTMELFPAFGQRLDEWEEAISHDFPRDTLGWSGLSADEQAARRDGLTQDTLPMCTDGGCSRRRDPAEVRAFEARAGGASARKSVAILREKGGGAVMAADNREHGTRIEDHSTILYPQLRLVDDTTVEWFDAVTAASIETPTGDVPPGGVVEIKSAVQRLASGGRGRFYIRQNQHESLVEANAWYLFVVVDDTHRHVYADRLVPAAVVDNDLGEWWNGGDGRARYQQRAWTTWIDTEQVPPSDVDAAAAVTDGGHDQDEEAGDGVE